MAKVTIKHERTSLYVEIQIDNSTYLMDQEQYAELYHTVLQHPPKNAEEVKQNERANWEEELADVMFGWHRMRKDETNDY